MDEGGIPLEGARVIANDTSGAAKETCTDSEGRYRLDGIAVGPSSPQLTVELRGYTTARSRIADIVEGGVTKADFVLGRLAHVSGYVLSRISGVVEYGQKYRPVAGVRVFIETVPTDDDPVHRYLGVTKTDAAGRFAFTDVAPHPAVRIAVVFGRGSRGSWSSKPFELRPGETVTDIEIFIN